MHRKNIKRLIKKQLKYKHPNWKWLNKKSKKKILEQITNEIMAEYDFSQELDIPIEKLTGIENQVPVNGIKTLQEMERYVANFYSDQLFNLDTKRPAWPEITNIELQFIDNLLDNNIVNKLIAPTNYTPTHRDIHPYQLFRMELLKIIKYPEISYRKYCSKEYFGPERKENRRFVGLPLNTTKIIDHTELCHFRSGVSFRQLMNALIYILHHFYKSGTLENNVIHGIDSSELPAETNYPLCTIKVQGKKINIYTDPDCECGKRRNKRDKSAYVIGYRMHTLTAINPSTGHSFPLVSLVSGANHHDRLFMKPLIKLTQAMGIDVKLVTADQAYHDHDGSVLSETGVYVVAPPSETTSLPDNVLEFPVRVTCNGDCDIPMKAIGCFDSGHEFICGAEAGDCIFDSTCPKTRVIPFDKGYFQPIPAFNGLSQKAIDIRKNCERPFNLMKKRDGLEQTRVRSQHGVIVRTAFTNIVSLLIEMAGTRHKQRKIKNKQKELFAATG